MLTTLPIFPLCETFANEVIASVQTTFPALEAQAFNADAHSPITIGARNPLNGDCWTVIGTIGPTQRNPANIEILIGDDPRGNPVARFTGPIKKAPDSATVCRAFVEYVKRERAKQEKEIAARQAINASQEAATKLTKQAKRAGMPIEGDTPHITISGRSGAYYERDEPAPRRRCHHAQPAHRHRHPRTGRADPQAVAAARQVPGCNGTHQEAGQQLPRCRHPRQLTCNHRLQAYSTLSTPRKERFYEPGLSALSQRAPRRARLALALKERGWEIFGYTEGDPNATDEVNLAHWHGYAKHPDYPDVIVVCGITDSNEQIYRRLDWAGQVQGPTGPTAGTTTSSLKASTRRWAAAPAGPAI